MMVGKYHLTLRCERCYATETFIDELRGLARHAARIAGWTIVPETDRVYCHAHKPPENAGGGNALS